MKNKNQLLNIFIILIGSVLVIYGGITMLSPQKGKENKNDEPYEEPKDILVDSTIINLATRVPSVVKENYESSFSVFQDKKITLDQISADVVYGSALNIINQSETRACTDEEIKNNPQCDFVINKKVILENTKKLYGNKYNNLPDKITGNMYLSCILNKDNYECLNHDIEDKEEQYNEYIQYFGSLSSQSFDRITRAEENSKYIYIYEEYISLRIKDIDKFDLNNLDTYNYSVYKYSNSDKLLTEDIVVGKELFKDKTKTFKDRILEMYEEKTAIFKHTFKKDNNNYIYISTEEL